MIRNLLFIAAGGAIGSVLRYLVSVFTIKIIGPNWLITGTAAVNIIGCILIGVVATILQQKGLMEDTVKLFLVVGFLGGFTTFSSFGLEGFEVATLSLQKGLIYMGFQVFTGIAAVWTGIEIGKWMV
jgi:CrcB protein